MLQPRRTRAMNPHRKLSRAQIAAGFGGKRRQASLKVKRRRVGSHKHSAAAKKRSNPKRRPASSSKPKRRVNHKHKAKKNTQRVVYKTRKVYVEKPKRRVKAKRRRSSNPGPYLMTLAPVLGSNPHKKRRKKTMAKPKRRVSAKRAGKRNPTRRRSTKRRTSHRPRSSNPFGQSTTTIVKTGFGVILGVSGAKLLPRQYPATWTGSPMLSILSTGVTAAALAWLAARFIRGPIADGVLWGGAAQTINVAVNAFAPPSISQYGLGDFVNGGFPLPQGPVRFITAPGPDMAPNGSQVNVGAFGRAW